MMQKLTCGASTIYINLFCATFCSFYLNYYNQRQVNQSNHNHSLRHCTGELALFFFFVFFCYLSSATSISLTKYLLDITIPVFSTQRSSLLKKKISKPPTSLGQNTENLGLTQVDLEHSRKRSSDKSIMLGQQKASCIIQYELTSENPALREVDLESCVKRGADRTEAQGSFY